jgi:hypothetical protein
MTKSRRIALPWLLPVALVIVGNAASAAEKASDLRKQITKTEEEYFALYNKLNTDRQYDVVCRKEAETGSTFLKRVCKPRYLEQAQQDAAAERMRSAISAAATASSGNTRGPDVGAGASGGPGVTTGGPDEGFRKNMLEVLQKSEELQVLGRKRDELEQRLAEATKK